VNEQRHEPSLQESIAGLMIMAGSVMVVGAVPLGAFLAFVDYGHNRDRWAFVLGGTLGAASAGLGVILFWGGWTIANRCWKSEHKKAPS